MRKRSNIVVWVPLVALILLAGKSFAQSKVSLDSTKKILNKLYKSNDLQDKAILKDDLKELAAGDENEMLLAMSYYYQLKDQRAVDSINNLLPVKFPNGVSARNAGVDSVYKSKTPLQKEIAYNKWIKKFPPSSFPDIDHDHIHYDYVRSAIADEYAADHNSAKAIEFINMLEEEFWKTNGYSGLAGEFIKVGDTVNAELYTKKAMDIAAKYYYAKDNDNAGKFAASGYPSLLSRYAQLLYAHKEYKDALSYVDKSYALNTDLSPGTNFLYAQVLAKLNRNQEAYDKLEAVVKAGKANPETVEMFKSLYVELHGSDKGYDAYTALIRQGFLADLQKKLTKEILNIQAPDFTLTDLDGNKVTLADLKGKIVILDFWATWCAPCKASFPAMQMAKNKFKNDPDVKFLFIHTWERGTTTPVEDARAFIKSKGYDFQVLMDLKDPDTKENKVVGSYKVSGIPSKFVIDKNGVIRYHLMGFDGSNEAAVDELSMMIDFAKQKSQN